MIKYKIDVLDALREAGYSTYTIRKKGLLAESTLTRLREGKTSISIDSLGVICAILRCQPSDILASEITDQEKIALFLDTPASGTIQTGRISGRPGRSRRAGSAVGRDDPDGQKFFYFFREILLTHAPLGCIVYLNKGQEPKTKNERAAGYEREQARNHHGDTKSRYGSEPISAELRNWDGNFPADSRRGHEGKAILP